MSILLEAKPVREKHLQLLKERCQTLTQSGVKPAMRVLLVGNLKASLIYTKNKKKFLEKLDAECEIIHLDELISEKDFLKTVDETVNNPNIHGCFVQLPLPKQLQHINVGNLIPPEKDVDGFHQQNLYEILHGDLGEKSLLPCTPKGILTLLDHYEIELEGKHVVVIGRSLIVGRPMALLGINANATITLCHSRTKNLSSFTKQADIIISAVGRPRFLDADYLSPEKHQVLIDVGINHDEEGKLCGDLDFENVKNHCLAITPVPGGVGPMTILSLAQNLISACERQKES
jgi:methylenetetrahydrofolate dehydrogenase (NADP+) / methenyltetrahydrofolate cyclohydrolase